MPSARRPPGPVYRQIANDLQRQIMSGELEDGARMPSVQDLQRSWGVGHHAAQQALALLKTRGLITTSPHGTFACARRAKSGPQQRFSEPDPTIERSEFSPAEIIIPAPGYVVPILDLTADTDRVTRVLRREWVTYEWLDGSSVPYRLTVTWYAPVHAGVVPELMARYPLPAGGGAKLIADRSGRQIIPSTSSWESRPIQQDGREGPMLRLTRGAHVLATVWTWDADDGTTLEYGESVIAEGKTIETVIVP